jgi:perosamine synthetase
MIPRLRPPFGPWDIVSSWWAAEEQDIQKFEKRFARQFGFEQGLFFPMGRSALYALLRALDWRDREIVLPAYTCAVVPHAVVVSGNRPRFVDCETDHFNVSPDAIEKILNHSTSMVIPTPIFGFPLEDEGYQEVCKRKAPGAMVLYDLAHGFGGQELCSGLKYADGAFFGLGIGKIISTLQGGMLLLRDMALAEKIRHYRDMHFQRSRSGTSLYLLIYGCAVWVAFREPLLCMTDFLERRTTILNYFTERFYGKRGPSIVDDAFVLPVKMQARMGIRQLDQYERIISARRDTSIRYEELLRNKNIKIFSARLGATYSHFPLLTMDRDRVIRGLRKRGVQVGTLIDYACPDLSGYEVFRGSCPNATKFSTRIINVPNWPGISSEQVSVIVDKIVEVLNG